jgi:putative heme iron utilization protein
MTEPLVPAVRDRICSHMNDDHADAVLLYAQVFGGCPQAQRASMVDLDPEGMTLQVALADQEVPVRIPFDHLLENAEDAHQTLIAMVRQARQR